MKVDRRTFFE